MFRRQKYSWSIACVVFIGLLLMVYMGSDLFLHTWDERYHALVAKNMLGHPLTPTLFDTPLVHFDYRMWTYNHIWVHKQPLPLWGIMCSFALFGVNPIAVRIPSILLMSLGTIISYRFGRKLFNRRVGWYASIFFATNGVILELASGRVTTDHIDVFFLFFVQLAVLLAWEFSDKKRAWLNILCGICIGLAILSKWLPALIVIPVWGAFLLHSKQFSWKEIVLHGFILCAAIVAVALPWQLYIYSQFPLEAAWESSFNQQHIFEALDGQAQPWYYHFSMMRINNGELIYLPLLWFIYKTIKKRSNWKYWALLIWILIPYLFFSVVQTKMQAYTLFTVPALFVVLALFIHYLMTHRSKFQYKWVPILTIFLLFALPIRFAIERLKPFQTVELPDWQVDINRLTKKIGNTEKVVVFNITRPIELMFHANCTAYNTPPSEATIQDLNKRGYTIYVNQETKVVQKGVRRIYYKALLGKPE